MGNKLHQFGHEPSKEYELSDDDIESIKNDLIAQLKGYTVEKGQETKNPTNPGISGLTVNVIPEAESSKKPVSQNGPILIFLGFSVTNMACN